MVRSPDLLGSLPVAGVATMGQAQFDKFRTLVHQLSGIHLADNKQALVVARISKRMRTLGIGDYGVYYEHVLGDRTGGELTHLINAISTNVTHFFREPRHFDLLGEWVRDWEQEGRKGLHLWSAASSTGEEPYSIAMTVLQSLSRPLRVDILASDISTRVLDAARSGIYRRQDVERIPQELVRKYFQVGGNDDELFRVKPALSEMVSYRQINLSTPPYPVQGDLDAIFCKNVMIYFTQDLRRLIVNEFQRMLRPGGYLVVGMAESLSAAKHDLRPVEPSVYRKP